MRRTSSGHQLSRPIARVVLNDLQHCTGRDILTINFGALAHGAKDLPLGNAGRGGPRVDRCFDPGRDGIGANSVSVAALYLTRLLINCSANE